MTEWNQFSPTNAKAPYHTAYWIATKFEGPSTYIFHCFDGKYRIQEEVWQGKTAGTFDDLDVAKVAYLMMYPQSTGATQ